MDFTCLGRRIHLTVSIPCLIAAVVVGLGLSGLWIGIQPIGGDPDLMYRPIKRILAESLHKGELPLWSDRFGLGAPLMAESHAAALYPLNLIFYRLLDPDFAYRFAMWLHHIASALTCYGLARVLGSSPWGSCLAGIIYALGGFAASHAVHEPFYHAMPYLPLILAMTERYAQSQWRWLAGIAGVWGIQLTLGHFQIAFWTGALAVFLTLWRTRSWKKTLGILGALIIGLMIASPQLLLTSELTSTSGFQRSYDLIARFPLPPGHWSNPISPWTFVWLPSDVDHPYWKHFNTTYTETLFYVGTLGFALALLGLFTSRQDPLIKPWPWIILVSLILATMAVWLPVGYEALTKLPGLGLFRAPGRYTLPATLGLALLASRGLDQIQLMNARSYRMIQAFLIVLATIGVGDSLWRFSSILGTRTALMASGIAAGSWLAALIFFELHRHNRLKSVWLILLTGAELTLLFYSGQVRWGWAIDPRQSLVLQQLAEEPDVGKIAGPLRNLPSSVGLDSAYPYLGITPPPPTYLLEACMEADPPKNPDTERWMRRFGVTHAVRKAKEQPNAIVDPILNQLLGEPPNTTWIIVRIDETFPKVRVGLQVELADSWPRLYSSVIADANPHTKFIRILQDQAPTSREPRASQAAIEPQNKTTDTNTITVHHDGPCDLIIQRAYYPGWIAQIEKGPEQTPFPADGGLLTIRLPRNSTNTSKIQLHYNPPSLQAGFFLAGLGWILVILIKYKMH